MWKIPIAFIIGLTVILRSRDGKGREGKVYSCVPADAIHLLRRPKNIAVFDK